MKSILVTFFLIFISIILYGLTLRGSAGNPNVTNITGNLDQSTKPFELSPERDRYLLTYTLAENKSFAIPKNIADANYSDIGYYNGKFYILFAPGISLLALPFYVVGKSLGIAQVASFAMISFFAVLTIVVLYKIAKHILQLPTWMSLLVPLIYAFASTSWSYAITLYQHQVTTFLIVSAFYSVWKFRHGNKTRWLYGLYIWFAYALAIAVDYPNAVLMLPVMVYFAVSGLKVIKDKQKLHINISVPFVVTAVVFALLIAAHGYYNYVNFGDVKQVSGGLLSYKVIKEQHLLDKSNGMQQISHLEQKKQPVQFFKEDNIPFGIGELLVAPDKGILFFSPIFLLAIFGIFTILRTIRLEIGILLALMGVNLLLYSSWGDPWGGWAFGPRYLIPTMAIASLFVGILLAKTKYKILSRILVFFLFAYSCAISLLGALSTNAVPPKVEADYLHMKYNFLLNLDYLRNGKSSSYVYNTFFHSHISLVTYFLLIYGFVIMIIFLTLFLPFKKRYEH